jgi:LDH2 family malate/lactate/ureidoglycolate dehydrogenase
MMPIDEFERRVDTLVREIRESPRAEGADRISLPGEIEWERRQKSLAEGIALPQDVRRSLEEIVARVRYRTFETCVNF